MPHPAIRFMTLDPGHFHAALVHGEMYPDVSDRVDVFAPVGADLVAHLHRLAGFNHRATRPTSWAWEVHAGPDGFARMLAERPGTVVVLSGRNRFKIDQILGAVEGGLHVLADKPWVLRSEDLP
ncbi:MAG: oxidoreductase, partial [Acidobacteriota bacterium]